MMELPPYGLRAYALLYTRHGSRGAFRQNELEWMVSEPMRKKIFALLLRSGWLVKESRGEYRCVKPEEAVKGLLAVRVPAVLKEAKWPYALTGMSAIEVWSDYAYVQRSFERSPYFVKVFKKDLNKWRTYLNSRSIPNYVGKGSTIGEFVILEPVERLARVEKGGWNVEPLQEALREAEGNYLFAYAAEYIRKKYGN